MWVGAAGAHWLVTTAERVPVGGEVCVMMMGRRVVMMSLFDFERDAQWQKKKNATLLSLTPARHSQLDTLTESRCHWRLDDDMKPSFTSLVIVQVHTTNGLAVGGRGRR
jgi:hypothetical protein